MQARFTLIFILFINIFLKSEIASAQKNQAKKDSTEIYKDIETYSKRSKFTDFIYKLIFKPVNVDVNKEKSKKKAYKKLIQKAYSNFDGKIIRNINIVTLDPFGYSVSDTIITNQSSLTNRANKLHVKSQSITIRNLLLIRENQPFDSLLVKESERLVRSMKYVHDVAFYVTSVSNKSDSVDIYIREMDNWSIIPGFYASPSHITFYLTENNFIGLGHEFKDHVSWYYANDKLPYSINYFIPNVRNTFINTTLHYGTDEFGNFTQVYSIDRPFFSPFAKWAAGINFTQQNQIDSIHLEDPIFTLHKNKFNSQDYWAGNSIQILKGNTEEYRTTNFISTLRIYQIQYLIKPLEETGRYNKYSNENFYFAGLGVSQRIYVQDKYIFNFGITEDVPIGKVYSVTGGYQTKYNSGRVYLGAHISSGNYYPWGYFSTSFEYGTFLRASKIEQGVFSFDMVYFTGLIEIGKWKFRQFIKPQMTLGTKRNPINDSLTLNDHYGLGGFNSITLSGNDRLLLSLQTQTYAPWDLIGFRFGPFFNYSLGMLGDKINGFKRHRLFSQIGFGILIKNDHLVLNTFQISISYYPLIPDYGQDKFKLNAFSTADFGLRDFEIGKPAVVDYR